MKKTILILTLILLNSLFTFAQKDSLNSSKINVFYNGLGSNNVGFRGSECDCSSKGNHYINFGISYSKTLKKWLDMELGIEFNKDFYGVRSTIPGSSENYSNYSVTMITLPVIFKGNIYKNYVFAKAGTLLDIGIDAEPSYKTSPTGIGFEIGLGAQYKFKKFATLFINPNLRFHNSLPFNNKSNYIFFQPGVRMGLSFDIN